MGVNPHGVFALRGMADTDGKFDRFPCEPLDLVEPSGLREDSGKLRNADRPPSGVVSLRDHGVRLHLIHPFPRHGSSELSEFMLGPLPPGSKRDPKRACRAAERAGLIVEDLRQERLRTTFYDVGAVVYFLRLVVWIVPGFTVGKYRDRLRELHEQIQRDGPFVAHSTRFLIETIKPG